MKIIEFPEQTTVYAENQQEYLNLPAHQFNDSEAKVAICWKATFSERLKILFTGVIWQQILTFDKPLQPLKLEAKKPIMVSTTEILTSTKTT